MLGSVKRLLTTLVEIVETRLAIAANEMEEQRARLAQWVVTVLVTTLLAGMAVLFVSLFLTVLFWDTNRIAVVGGLALFYVTLAAISAIVLRQRLKNRPRMFATILAELHKDREDLGTHP